MNTSMFFFSKVDNKLVKFYVVCAIVEAQTGFDLDEHFSHLSSVMSGVKSWSEFTKTNTQKWVKFIDVHYNIVLSQTDICWDGVNDYETCAKRARESAHICETEAANVQSYVERIKNIYKLSDEDKVSYYFRNGGQMLRSIGAIVAEATW